MTSVSYTHLDVYKRQVLDDVCMDVRAGEVLALMGENGAGKSTLIKIITGVEKADAGEIVYMGPVSYTHLDVYKRQGRPLQ